MVEKHHVIGGGMAFLGFVLFAFGFYIIPFGTDMYLYFWVQMVFGGNWLYGSIAGNLFALFLIAAGLLILHKEGKSPYPKNRKKKPKKEKSKKKSKKAKIEDEVMYL